MPPSSAVCVLPRLLILVAIFDVCVNRVWSRTIFTFAPPSIRKMIVVDLRLDYGFQCFREIVERGILISGWNFSYSSLISTCFLSASVSFLPEFVR